MTINDARIPAASYPPVLLPVQTAFDEPNKQGTVAVVGLGYVGLPTSIGFADAGLPVIGYDVDPLRLHRIQTEDVDLLEIDRHRLRRLLDSDDFRLTDDAAELGTAEFVVICVPTPIDSYLVPDLRALRSACATAVATATPGQTIVLTSTSYVGCTRELLVEPLQARGLEIGKDVFVAFSPERIDPGNDVHRHDTVPRIVGGVTPECRERAFAALRQVTSLVHVVGSPEAAEAAKLLENTFRAVNIAFVNEFADACAELNLDVLEVIEAAATKPYGFMPFYPGPGVGGHCVPCDPHYLLWQLRARRTHLPLTEAAMSAIAVRPRRVVARAREMLLASTGSVVGARVLVVGVSYKPGVQDVRESPALEILSELLHSGADVHYTDAYVPELDVDGRTLTTVEDPQTAGTWDLVIVHTQHPDADNAWLSGCPSVLDATYRATDLAQRALI